MTILAVVEVSRALCREGGGDTMLVPAPRVLPACSDPLEWSEQSLGAIADPHGPSRPRGPASQSLACWMGRRPPSGHLARLRAAEESQGREVVHLA